MMSKKILVAMAVACLLGGWLILAAAPAEGATILTLSSASSDSTPAAYLRGMLTFDVTDDILMLTVTNDTAAPHAYSINQIFFNATENVTGLTLIGPDDWALRFREDGNRAAPFGKFDVALIGGVGCSPNEIDPGESITFTMMIQGTGPFATRDFTTEASYSWGGQKPSHAAAKFIRGPQDDSARGNAVPEPMTVSFIGAGLIGVCLMRRCRGRGCVSARRA